VNAPIAATQSYFLMSSEESDEGGPMMVSGSNTTLTAIDESCMTTSTAEAACALAGPTTARAHPCLPSDSALGRWDGGTRQFLKSPARRLGHLLGALPALIRIEHQGAIDQRDNLDLHARQHR
jgi:hypothetical protein